MKFLSFLSFVIFFTIVISKCAENLKAGKIQMYTNSITYSVNVLSQYYSKPKTKIEPRAFID